MQAPQSKCMDLPALYRVQNGVGIDDNHANHYLRFGNREYMRDTARSDCLRIWVSWYDVQKAFSRPTSYQDHCNQLNLRASAADPRGKDTEGYWNRLDEVIRAANDDGILVVLAMLHEYPLWAVPVSTSEPETGKAPTRHFPDVEISGLWDNFISYVYNRYRHRPSMSPNGNGFYNSVGPGNGASAENYWMGNPRRASIAAFEIVNEPNYTHWPQAGGSNGDVYCYTARMIQTAENAVNFWNGLAGGAGPMLLAPALADNATNVPASGDGVRKVTNYYDAANGILNNLSNFRPRVYIAWSHHNYGDWTDRANGSTAYSRLARVRDLLYQRNWRGGGDRNVLVTEGGYRFPHAWPGAAEQTRQVNAMTRIHNDFLAMPEAALLTNFTRHVVDGSDFNTGVRQWNVGDTFPASTTFAAI